MDARICVTLLASALLATAAAAALASDRGQAAPAVAAAIPGPARESADDGGQSPIAAASGPRLPATPRQEEAAAAIRMPVEVRHEAPLPLGDEERVTRRVEVMAKKLGLSAPDAEALRLVLVQEQARRGPVFADLHRDPDGAATRARARAELDAILAWKTAALEARFGTERATAIQRR